MERLTKKQLHDVGILVRFVELYCKGHHSSGRSNVSIADTGQTARLCTDCEQLIAYAIMKRKKCPLDPKPSCKNCHIHCYGTDYREKIRQVMAYSGRKMLMRGRIDMLWHYYF